MEKGMAIAAATGVATSWIADQWAMHIIGVPVSVVLATFAGAFLALSWQRKLPPTAKCASVWIGTFGGAYLTPLVLHFGNIDPGFQLAVAFGVGLIAEPALHRVWLRVPQIVDKRTGGKS